MDHAITKKIIGEFSDAAYESYGRSYAYEAGYLQSVVTQLLERVPADVCFEYLQQFEKTTKELRQRQLINTIKETA
jgi:hypothetical protein